LQGHPGHVPDRNKVLMLYPYPLPLRSGIGSTPQHRFGAREAQPVWMFTSLWCRPFSDSSASALVNSLSQVLTTVTISDINVVNVTQVRPSRIDKCPRIGVVSGSVRVTHSPHRGRFLVEAWSISHWHPRA